MDDLSALREEVARALAIYRGANPDFYSSIDSNEARTVVDVIFADPSRLVRVLTDQPCATCEGSGRVDLPSPRVKVGSTWATQTIALSGNCSHCSGSGRLDVVAALVEAGILEGPIRTRGLCANQGDLAGKPLYARRGTE